MVKVDATIQREFARELAKGRERVVTGQDGEVGWLIRFLQLDLETLTPSEWMVFAYEVAAFVEADCLAKDGLPLLSATGWAMQAMPGESRDYTLPNRKEGAQLQRSVHHHLESLWKHGTAQIRFKNITLVVTQPGALHARHGSMLVSTRPKAKEFEYRVALLLRESAGRIRQCAECQRVFLAIRLDQLYCDPRCQMRVASRKWRKANKHIPKKERR